MTSTRRLVLVDLFILAAVAVPACWLVVLWPFLTHTGPAPGAGAQYVFLMLPTVGLATLALAALVASQAVALKRTGLSGRAVHLAITVAGGVVLLTLVLFWVRFLFRFARA